MSKSERARYTCNPVDWVAGCSDVGIRHHSNQDALHIAVRADDEPRTAIIAVADGVSSAAGSEVASAVAVERAVNALQDRLDHGLPENVAFVQAFDEANQAVHEAGAGSEPSACTLITAHVCAGSIAIANVGDSRAYWIGDDATCALLSTDDSMAQARIQLGMSRADAEQGNQAHAITRWLGRDAKNVTPTVTVHQPAASGWLLLCTDGLWNYASSPEEMQALVTDVARQHRGAKDIAEALVDWANAEGGKDNITAVLMRITM